MLHLFRFDTSAVSIPPGGNPVGAKYRLGDWTCVMCKALLSFCVRFDLDHGDDCPGPAERAEGGRAPDGV